MQGGAEALSKADDKAWAQPLGAAILAIRHIGLGGWQQQECLALENELGCWQSQGKLAEATNMLRCNAHSMSAEDGPCMPSCARVIWQGSTLREKMVLCLQSTAPLGTKLHLTSMG